MKNNNKQERKYLVSTSIGLQDVDNLKVSKYYDQLSQKYINNEIQLDEFSKIIESYYEDKSDSEIDKENKEADLVANSINILLSDDAFSLNLQYFLSIHKFLFDGILKNAGEFRNKNILKKEWILNGQSVIYGDYRQIKQTFDYDFKEEKEYKYSANIDETIVHIANFISNIWQNHPFLEGNTRTTAVFLIKYLAFLGFEVKNDTFKNNSWYFRNALVRANYSNVLKGINENKNFLIKFLRNLLLNEKNILSNRQMHINALENIKQALSNRQQTILELIKSNSNITLNEIACKTQRSLITIKRDISVLKKMKILKRINSKKNGSWIIVGLDNKIN